MPPGMQAKLLRALQERTVRPVGGDQESPVRRAHHRGDEPRPRDRGRGEALPRGPLLPHQRRPHPRAAAARARGDILLLAQHFLERYARPEPASRDRHRRARPPTSSSTYPWPGNVRELQNCIERAVALAQFDQIGVDDLPEKIRDYRTAARSPSRRNDPAELLPMDEVERRYILRVLEAVGGNKTLAAQVLGFDRRTLYRKLERYGATDAADRTESARFCPPDASGRPSSPPTVGAS